jgi:anthranilate synthase component 2
VKKLLILDNYDSFTYNLAQLVEQHGGWDFDIRKNDLITLEKISDYDKILLSPGPGMPQDAGIMPLLIREYASTKSILGVCLGHHAIAQAFGGELYNFELPYHGIQHWVTKLIDDTIFMDIPKNFQVGLYHSWAVSNEKLMPDLEILAQSEKGIIMALIHKEYDVKSVQFHPESIMTPNGKTMINNWLNN